MKKFEVEAQEVSITTYVIEAENEEEALKKYERAEYESQDLFSEFSHTITDSTYPKVKEVRE